ncbi:ARS binding protein 2-domain-containing protein [Diaporthe sp. PMI_573]|nr:ARS binding protein 2-domain-containing protein [Diaporthaceae sp. PMI_573]
MATRGLPRPSSGAAALQIPAPRPTSTRRALPHRKVTPETIDDAYAQFILCCNPGVPPETDTAVLRDAFRIPPKSGGKSFSTYTLFELIGLFQSKEIKTWADLALQLGVEPPDQDKGQSAQKIQQYAVRLKRWMHSMHIDAFFDYLLGNPHPYWTDIPTDPNPVLEDGRDGVAAEDDMALRSLLPQIRPRRGRKRPENEDSSRSPSQRPRTESGGEELGVGGAGGGAIQPLDLWPAHPGTTSGAVVFPSPSQDQFARLNLNLGTPGAAWAGENFAQTPLTAQTYSAMTPSPGNGFWPGQPTDTKLTAASSKPKANKRHGAKVVSSAWRSGGPGGPGKTRGRPPLNRQNTSSTSDASPFHAFPAQNSPTYDHVSPHMTPNITATVMAASPNHPTASLAPEPQSNLIMNQQHAAFDASMQDQPHPRTLRPTRSRLSLQVPERAGADVRLASPPGSTGTPPVVMINGREMRSHHNANFGAIPQNTDALTMEAFGTASHSPSSQHQAAAEDRKGIHFSDPNDRTNLDALESFFIYDIVGADWFDSTGAQIPPCSVDEAAGIYQQVIEDVMNGAASKETFLINVAALVGGGLLRSGRNVKVHKTMGGDESSVYDCNWELQVGDVKGAYSIRVALPHGKWKGYSSSKSRGNKYTHGAAGADEDAEGEQDDGDMVDRDDDDGAQGGHEEIRWQRKYRDLLEIVQQQKSELSDIRKGMLGLLQQPRTWNPGE